MASDIDAICVLNELLVACMERYQCSDYEIVATFAGRDAEKVMLTASFL